MPDLLTTFVISLLIQAVFFLIAAPLKTDKVTDLSYGLTFIALALILLFQNNPSQPAQLALASMVVVWGIRLAGYLLYRITRIKRDPRFDGIRERFWKFLQFWLFQGIVVWVIMLPVTLWFGNPGPWRPMMFAAVIVWLAGLLIETVADIQKFRYKTLAGEDARWMASGLWQYSRHPNYFGELLCWWGVFLFTAGDLGVWTWLAVLGPLSLTVILLYVTGIPTLERSAERKWGSDPGYRQYRKTTSMLIPWPPRKG